MPRATQSSRKAKKVTLRTVKPAQSTTASHFASVHGDDKTTGLLELWQEFGVIKGAFRDDDHYIITMTGIAQIPKAKHLVVTPPFRTWLFVAWLEQNGLTQRPWSDDDLWYLASEDFGPANGYELPPRDAFLADVALLKAPPRHSLKLAA